MANQKGSILFLGILIGAVIVVFAWVFSVGLRQSEVSSQNPNNSSSVTSSNPTATVAPNRASLKTYTNNKYGISFVYHQDFQITVKNDATAQYLLSIKSPNQEYAFEAYPLEGYGKYPPGTKPEGTKVFGSKTWEYLPAGQFGDAGQTFTISPQYQIDNGTYRFNFKMVNPKELTPVLEDIISTFQFTK